LTLSASGEPLVTDAETPRELLHAMLRSIARDEAIQPLFDAPLGVLMRPLPGVRTR